jgi:hypothetical protein
MAWDEVRTEWLDERIERLKIMYNRGDTYRVIADDLGVSRNAVAGAIRRYVERRPNSRKEKQSPTVQKPAFIPYIVVKKKSQPMIAQTRVKHGRTIWAEGGCLCVISENVRDRPIMGCGQPRYMGSSWCKQHYEVFLPAVKKQ